LGVKTVSPPETPHLLLLALAPGLVALALGTFLLNNGRARALAATVISVGLALSGLTLVVAGAYAFAPLSELAESLVLIFGMPLVAFVLALSVLLRRAQSSLLTSISCALAGLAGLYWLGAFVLMLSACSFNSGGC